MCLLKWASNRRSKAVTIGLLLVLFPLTSILTSGCWDRTEIEDRALILGLAIDEAGHDSESKEDVVTHLNGDTTIPEEKMIQVTAQIAVPGRISLEPGNPVQQDVNPVWIVKVTGHTLNEAMNNLQQQIADARTLVHLRIIVVSEAIARKGIGMINDYLHRNQEIRRSTWMLVAKNRADEFMTVAPPLERVPTLYLLTTLEQAVKMGKFPNDFIGIFWSYSSKRGQEGYLPLVEITDGAHVKLSGMAYFKSDRMAGETRPLEIGAYMAAMQMNPGGYSPLISVPSVGEFIVKATKRYSQIHPEIRDGKPHISVSISIEAELEEKALSRLTIDKEEALELIERAYKKQFNRGLEELIRKTQSGQSDIFGFGEWIRAKKPGYWNRQVRTKENWQKLYEHLEVELNTRVKIRRTGLKIG